MPAQLLSRLNRFLDSQHATVVNALENTPRADVLGPVPDEDPAKPGKPASNTKPHWPKVSFGAAMTNIQSVMIHETSGWPSYYSAVNFRQLYSCLDYLAWIENPGQWIDRRGIGPQYFVEPNGTAFALIGPENLAGAPRITWHGETLTAISLGIENAYIADGPVDPGQGLGPLWWRLTDQAEDLTGMKAYVVLHPNGAEDAVLVWIARFPNFRGCGDIEDGQNPATDRRMARDPKWKNMLFSERNYRSLALLCRLLAEQNGIPRNFPLLPYLDNSRDGSRADLFRKLILSDQRRDQLARKLGTTTANIQANGLTFSTWYNAQSARIWSRFFGWDPNPDGDPNTNDGRVDLPCYRGFLSHDINGSHTCPGPLFDWHRFAREVWDWWWYPFDLEPLAVSTTPRPYLKARRSTPLIDYYYDTSASAADYNLLHAPSLFTERFVLPESAPVYAIANGVVVAARFAMSNSAASSGFVLVRHEVFHLSSSNRINYDIAPTYVWSLTHYLSNAGFGVNQIGGANPDWLNRFVMRLRECELAVGFHTTTFATPPANAEQKKMRAAFTRGWDHTPSGAGPRLATGEEIERDATAYRALANDLMAGRPVLFPLEANPAPTPVRVILGDFLGFPNRMPDNQFGIQVEIFSNDKLDVTGATRRAVSAFNEAWWKDASAAIRHEAVVDMDLPADGLGWHYRMTDFLEWMNNITWASEWEKYGAVDQGGAPVARPPRPLTRVVS